MESSRRKLLAEIRAREEAELGR